MRPSTKADGSIDFSKIKILVVDDQNEARAMIKNMLTEMGVTQVFEAPDGRQALAFIDTAFDFVDLIICDWNMPGLTGVELLRQLRTVYTDVPFLMVTGRSDMASVSEAKSSGVTAYICKPFSADQLETKLRIVIKKKLNNL
ncbi:MAG: response regulator [Alphaproteobacteria bacterium]|nr:response regulator [Alphaproteobacteria bacterium]